jgi:carbamoyltransferase
MSTPRYVLGLNTYDHDVSACLLRDGVIVYAIEKERITREKHATGFYKEVIDYCLDAEGITLKDVELVVSNCYILPVPENTSAPTRSSIRCIARATGS